MKADYPVKPTYTTVNRGFIPVFLDIIYSEVLVDVDSALNPINLFFCDFSIMTARWSD
jgi:hypothetical protein